MKMIHFISTTTILFVTLLLFESVGDAQVSRMFVSSDGKNNDVCGGLDKPCRDINVAVSKVQAGGEVVILDSGNYQPLTVNKSVDIVAAPDAHPSVSVTSGEGITINAGPNDTVRLHGLRIISQGGARGIHFQSGRALHVERCVISGFTPLPSDCCTDGILVTTPSKVVIKDTLTEGNFNGVRIFSSVSASIERSQIENNSNGLWAEEIARVTISDSLVMGNFSGVTSFIGSSSSASAPAEISVDNCRVSGNVQGIVSTGKSGDNANIWTVVRVSRTTVTNNGQGLVVGTPGSGRIFSRGNNTVEGNNVDGTFTDPFTAK